MKRFLVLLLASMVANNLSQCQNLVLNGDFEDVNICDEYHAPCSPSAWFFMNKTGAQGYSREGDLGSKKENRFLALMVARPNNSSRQYWETMLLSPVKQGTTYKVSFRYFSDSVYSPLSNFGIYFSNQFIFTWDDSAIHPSSYISFTDARIRKPKDGWITVEKEFVADSDAGFLILGNFSTTSNTDILMNAGGNPRKLFFPIDDLVIKPTDAHGLAINNGLADSLYSLTRRHYVAPVVAKREVAEALKRPVIVDDLEPRVDTIRLTNIEFEFDQYRIKNTDVLDPYKRILLRQGIQKVVVIGYTDSKGSDEYNKELSVKRSKEIAGLLTQKFNISSSIIESEGRGKSVQFSDDARNRRVEIYVYY